MRSAWSAKLLMFACAALLMACSGSGAPNSAVGGGGGPVGGGGEEILKGGAAAQPMDTGSAGSTKDYENIKYFLRDAAATVLCKAGTGQVKVRFQGFLMSESPSGETHSTAGLLKVSDISGGHFQVTPTSMDSAQHGFFKTTLKVQNGLNVLFFLVLNHNGPLETLLPVDPEGISIGFPAEPRPELKVEQGPSAANPCMEAAQEYEASEV